MHDVVSSVQSLVCYALDRDVQLRNAKNDIQSLNTTIEKLTKEISVHKDQYQKAEVLTSFFFFKLKKSIILGI